jgi:hypothetical protein
MLHPLNAHLSADPRSRRGQAGTDSNSMSLTFGASGGACAKVASLWIAVAQPLFGGEMRLVAVSRRIVEAIEIHPGDERRKVKITALGLVAEVPNLARRKQGESLD